ncbi:MAG: pyrroline-5-carboxylate reductase [Erysipelotrichaceae bacterium]|nr:MAG: pyrroline-5-carboxylate [Erysipelotrichaceae bacterium]TXT19626.1 MAG: pyrroline-5-carboxylate reductase [Erysipelotrichaceae bacterium]
MKPFKLGLLGYGKMGKALIDGLITQGFLDETNLFVYTPHSSPKAKSDHPGVNICLDSYEMCEKSDIILLAVKPQILPSVLRILRNHLKNKVIISIAAGITTENLVAMVEPSTQVIRVMPNLAVEVQEGVILLSKAHNLNHENLNICAVMFSKLGLVVLIDENKMDIGSVLIGSGPAFLAYFINAMKLGASGQFSDKETYRMLYHTITGTIAYLQENNMDPQDLIERVCSPNGSTIEGIQSLRDDGVENQIVHAVRQSEARAKALGKI